MRENKDKRMSSDGYKYQALPKTEAAAWRKDTDFHHEKAMADLQEKSFNRIVRKDLRI